MRPNEIEGWALQIADDIIKYNRPIEDTRVEIKAKWLDPKDMARRIAAHANAAHGESILWIIGIDERKRTVEGADKNDLASWFPQVQAEFSELAPPVTDLNVPYGGKTIVALLFDTDRAPFVVRNPVFGNPGAGSVSLEVPWREGTSTRSASRSDLLRLLLPLQQLPVVTVLGMYLLGNADQDSLSWRLDAKLYIASKSKGDIIFPFHTSSAFADIFDERRHVPLPDVSFNPNLSSSNRNPSNTVQFSDTDVLITNAGMVVFRAHGRTTLREYGNNIGDPAHVRIELVQAHESTPIIITKTLQSVPSEMPQSRWGTWRWGERIG